MPSCTATSVAYNGWKAPRKARSGNSLPKNGKCFHPREEDQWNRGVRGVCVSLLSDKVCLEWNPYTLGPVAPRSLPCPSPAYSLGDRRVGRSASPRGRKVFKTGDVVSYQRS